MVTTQTWIAQVSELFNDIFWALMDVPILSLFLGILLFLIVVGLFSWLVHLGKRGKL